MRSPEDRPSVLHAPEQMGARSVALFFAATGGGVQKGRVNLANALAERGFDVACVLPQVQGPFLARLSPKVRLIDLGSRSPLLLVWRLARYLRAHRPATVIASQQHTILAALWARPLAGVPLRLVITQHNTLSELCRQSRRPTVRWLLPLMARLFYRSADQVCAVSQGVAKDLARITGIAESNIRIVHNPVVTSRLAAEAAASSGHVWLDEKDRPVVLGVGNLIRIKDFATLIRAFARVREMLPARLVILGEGDQRPHLERLAREVGVTADIDLPGFRPNPCAFMARADVFVLASRVEGLSNAIVEALACGCPVVSTDCPHGPAEVLQHGDYGRLVPVGDEVGLANAIMVTLREPPNCERLRQRAADFSVDRAVERYLDFLDGDAASGTKSRALSPGKRRSGLTRR